MTDLVTVPLADIGKRAEKLGFRLEWADEKTLTLSGEKGRGDLLDPDRKGERRQFTVRLVPITDHAQEALNSAAGYEVQDVTAGTAYTVGHDDLGEVAVQTATIALDRAKGAL